MITIPLKITREIDLNTPLSEYIREEYGKDPEEFKYDINTFHKLRSEILHSSPTVFWRNTVYRYLYVFEHALPRLKEATSSQGLQQDFSWSDIYTQAYATQKSFAHEKGCIIFNLAAICNGIACKQDKSGEEGQKIAFAHLQVAAGLFNHINSNFLYPATIDMRPESTGFLSKTLLAEAQEIFLEKSLLMKRNSSIVCKLASQIEDYYTESVELLKSDSIMEYVPGSWVTLAKSKMIYYKIFSLFHYALSLWNSDQKGVAVAHLSVANKDSAQLAKQVKSCKSLIPKLPKSLDYLNSSSCTSGSGSVDLRSVELFIKQAEILIPMVADKYREAEKDNNVVYHQIVPSVETLKKAPALNAVKYEEYNILTKGGTDPPNKKLFSKLISTNVMKASSIYYEMEAKKLDEVTKICNKADMNLHVTFEKSKIFKVFPILATLVFESGNLIDGMLKEGVPLKEMISEVSRTELLTSGEGTKFLITKVQDMKERVSKKISEMEEMIKRDDAHNSIMCAKFFSEWNQRKIIEENYDLTNSVFKISSEFRQISTDVDQIIPKLETSLKQILVFKNVADLDKKVEEIISSKISENILDNLLPDDRDKIKELSSKLSELKRIRSERQSLCSKMKKTLSEDELHSMLFKAKDPEEVFSGEISKHKPIEENIKHNINEQHKLLNSAIGFHEEIKKLDLYTQVKPVVNEVFDIFDSHKSNFNIWKDNITALKDKKVALESIEPSVDHAFKKITKLISQRESERHAIKENLDSRKSTTVLNDLRTKLDRLSVSMDVGHQKENYSKNADLSNYTKSKTSESPDSEDFSYLHEDYSRPPKNPNNFAKDAYLGYNSIERETPAMPPKRRLYENPK